MSLELIVRAFKTKVGNPARKLILIKLADNANDQGECWPSYQHIADQCECDRSTVIRQIKELEREDLLSIEKRKGPKGNSSNIFHLHLEGSGTEQLPSGTKPPPPSGRAPPRISNSFESVNESICKKSDLFKRFFLIYPVNKKGGTDATAWKKAKALKLKDSDFELMITDIEKRKSLTPEWFTTFALGICKYLDQKFWLTPIQGINQFAKPVATNSAWGKEFGK